MPNQPADWRLVLQSYPCPACGALAGEACITTGGKRAVAPHADRGRGGNRCPRCGAPVGAEALPGDLCSHCRLVRSLEVERATKWVRREP